jgi:molecular chaperone Hsp33
MPVMRDNDVLQRFLFDGTDIRGEITSLSSSYRAMTAIQNYPQSIRRLFGEFLAAASLIGASLKYPGIISVQATGNGPVSMIIAECNQKQQLRGIVRGDFNQVPRNHINNDIGLSTLLGKGTIAITIEPEKGERYQGVVSMELDNLSDCLEFYFEQSAQLSTKIKLASSSTRASGILIQQLPKDKSKNRSEADWQHFSTLVDTLKPEEQTNLSHNEQLYRLFHEDEVRLFECQSVSFACNCSLKRTEQAMISIGLEELLKTCKEHGLIEITCQFCDKEYIFSKDQVVEIFKPDAKVLH